MKKNDLTGLRAKTKSELEKVLADKGKELTKARMAIMGNTEKNLRKGKNLRHGIAKIMTIIKEKEIMEKINKEKGEVKK